MEVRHRFDMYKLLPKNPVTAEIGVAEGLFSADICRVWKPKKHYCVDMWESHPEFKGDAGFPQDWHNKNYREAQERLKEYPVEFLRGPSHAMAQQVKDKSLHFVNIDACHTYECVKSDIAAWWPKLKSNGIMCFHDYENTDYGVKQAVQEFAQEHGLEINLLPENKPDDAGAWISKPTSSPSTKETLFD